MSKKQRNKVNNAQKAMSEMGGWSPYTHVHTHIHHTQMHTYIHTHHTQFRSHDRQLE